LSFKKAYREVKEAEGAENDHHEEVGVPEGLRFANFSWRKGSGFRVRGSGIRV
jgi:hypothetical protein